MESILQVWFSRKLLTNRPIWQGIDWQTCFSIPQSAVRTRPQQTRFWAGVPLITCPGNRFTERVASSLLSAAQMGFLIVPNLEEYQRLAVDLANHPLKLIQIRNDGKNRRTSSRLFNTRLRVKQFETAFRTIWQRYSRGLPPCNQFISNDSI